MDCESVEMDEMDGCLYERMSVLEEEEERDGERKC